MPEVLASLATLRATGVTVNPPSLEELFMRHYHAEIEEPVPPSLESASR